MRDSLGIPQTLLVLGGNSEIGLATARRLVARGTQRVLLGVRDVPGSAQALESLRRDGAEAEAFEFDATRLDSHGDFVRMVFDGDRDIDGVLVAFGVYRDQSECEADVAVAQQVAETNFVGVVSVTALIAARLRDQGQGVIVLLSSTAAERPRRSHYVYGASKAGADAFFQGLGDALAGSGVSVLVVRPGSVGTKMNAGRRQPPWATTSDAVAEAIGRALERGSSTIWVPSSLRWVMFVVRYLPRPLFRRLSAIADR